ncbi:MAG: hypothetical protein MUF15_16865 [Acidobacteria bacterium]|nr:hypothetical protein [Acidobacteriota bacterium]
MKRLLLGIVFVTLGFIMVFAETYEHKKSGFSTWVPDTRQVRTEKNLLDAETKTCTLTYTHLDIQS